MPDKPDSSIRGLYAPDESALLLIDFQPVMVFGVQSIDRQLLVNNVTTLAKTAKAFNVPTILTTVGAEQFAGPILPEIRAVFSDQPIIDRSWINA